MKQARFWILTIPHADFLPWLPPGVAYIRGQLERGERTGYEHWQLCVSFTSKQRLRAVKSIFGDSCHAEPTRSDAAREYVWKQDTSIPDTQFELGTLPLRRGNPTDWEVIRENARRGQLDAIPGDVYCRLYNNLKRIAVDHMDPVGIERTVTVYWGRTGTGKSRRAWNEAGENAYPKDPRSKFWDGYRNHEHVVCDEFRGGIDISHLLRWFDRYPVIVEVKGSSVVLRAKRIWITSNLDPRNWYPDVDQETLNALLRRLNITHFP